MSLEVVHDDKRVRVTRLTLAEAEQTPVHTHEVEELSITIAGSSVQERDPDGFLLADHLTAPGDVRLITVGTGPHYLVNSGVGPYVAIIVETKVPSPAHRPTRPKKAKA
jgi:quercetin dioxygenase-like cupin family protein